MLQTWQQLIDEAPDPLAALSQVSDWWQTMTREEMLEALDASFVFFLESMRDSAGDLDRGVSLRGTPAVVGDIWIRATVHLHEHLGQSIAYARANEVVPPWSR